MSDTEVLIHTVPRGRGELRIYRERREDRCETRLQVWYRDGDGELQPSRSSARVRDGELSEVLAVLQRIQRRISRGEREQSQPDDDCPPPETTTRRHRTVHADDLEDVF